MSRLAYLAGRGRKALAGLVGVIIGAGGVEAVAPGLPPQWQAAITAVVTVLSVWVVPENAPKQSNPGPVDEHAPAALED